MSQSLKNVPSASLYSELEHVAVDPNTPAARFINWGQTFSCTPLVVFEPETEHQCSLILELARREGKRVRFAGVGHSPSDLACTGDYMLRTVKLNRVLEVNVEKCFVVVQGGITLEDLHEKLHMHGLGMSNLGSISEQTLAGVIATATHGSGITFGVLSTLVLELTLLLADGTVVTCSQIEQPRLFKASLCGLGATGLILSAKIQVEPEYRLKEYQETQKFDDVIDQLELLVLEAEHVRFWWFPQNGKVRCSFSDRTSESLSPAGSWLWRRLLGYHFIQLMLFLGIYVQKFNTWAALLAEWLISNQTVGVDISHRIFNVDCRYPQHTTEWAVPLSQASSCLRELRSWLEEELADPDGLRPHFPVEIRFSEADDIWLSPSYGERTCWIGIVQYKPYGYNVPYRRLFERYENIVQRHGGKPHWAKAHGLRPNDLGKIYPHFDDFRHVLEEVDPSGMFRNEYIRRHIFGEQNAGVDRGIFCTTSWTKDN